MNCMEARRAIQEALGGPSGTPMELARRLSLEAHQHLEQCGRCREETHQWLAVDNLLLTELPPPPEMVSTIMARVRAREAVAETDFSLRDEDFGWPQDSQPVATVESRRPFAIWAACMLASWSMCYLLWSAPWPAIGDWWSSYVMSADGWTVAAENAVTALMVGAWDSLSQTSELLGTALSTDASLMLAILLLAATMVANLRLCRSLA